MPKLQELIRMLLVKYGTDSQATISFMIKDTKDVDEYLKDFNENNKWPEPMELTDKEKKEVIEEFHVEQHKYEVDMTIEDIWSNIIYKKGFKE